MSSTAISTHLLDIDKDYTSVLNGVHCLSANWRKIGLSLGVSYNTVDAIEGERKKASDMLMDLLAVWLRRESEGQPKPTWKKLCEAVNTIDRTRAEVLAQEHQCDCPVCLAGTRNTPVANEIQNYDVVEAATALKKEFSDLMAFTAKEIQSANVEELRFRINEFVKDERGKPCEVVETHLSRIEDYVAPSAILNYLYRHEFIGYINYALIKVVQKLIKSKLLDRYIKEYESDYQLFLQCALKDIHSAFKKCPDLQPNYPVGLPSFIIHLESEWDGQSMYKWKELFERRFSWPETLNIVKISENCIIITCTVWPKFAEEVAKDLTNPEIIADLKKEGVTINISPQLQAYLQHDSDLLNTSKKEVFVTVEDQLSIKHQIKADILTSLVGDTDDDKSDVSIDTIPEVQTLKGNQPAEGMLSIKLDWNEQVADDDTCTSEYVSLKPNSDGQTVASGDTEGRQLVELQDDVTLKEAIDTYEHIVRKLLQEKESVEKQLVIEREMRMKAIMELDQSKAQYLKSKHSSAEHHSRVDDTKLLQIEKVLTNREKVIETMRRDIERLQERVAADVLTGPVGDTDDDKSDVSIDTISEVQRLKVADDDTSGYESMKPSSDGQTVASGDTEGNLLGLISSTPSSDMSAFRKIFSKARHIVVLSGAGISAESGVPTYKGAGGYWRTYQAQELATPEAFEDNPSLVWEFYSYRREVMHPKTPNAAHLAIAELEERLGKQGRKVTVITQNIDRLHHRAGSKDVIELHGSLFFTRCTKCGDVRENHDSPIVPALKDKGSPDPDAKDAKIPLKELPTCVVCNSLLRPNVIWFGEPLDYDIISRTREELRKCDLCLLVGTASDVYPAAGYAPDLAARGIPVAEFNLEETPVTGTLKFHFQGKCGETLPKAIARHPSESPIEEKE